MIYRTGSNLVATHGRFIQNSELNKMFAAAKITKTHITAGFLLTSF